MTDYRFSQETNADEDPVADFFSLPWGCSVCTASNLAWVGILPLIMERYAISASQAGVAGGGFSR
jgi:hypothetical protein